MRNNRQFRMAVRLVTVVTLAGLLAACSRNNSFQDLEQYVQEVQARPGAEVEPVPVFEAYEAFTYSAASLRSPFDVPVVVLQSAGSTPAEDVVPDLQRIREPLEEYALSELAMVGMLERDGRYQALVRDTVGRVSRVSVGNYLGRNHGRIVTISPTQIDVLEIVPSGDGGWVERPQSLTLVQ